MFGFYVSKDNPENLGLPRVPSEMLLHILFHQGEM